MKANVLHAVGQLVYEEVEIPALTKEQVLVQVMAAGICGSDVGRVLKTGTYHFPTIIGHEFAGRVVEVGDSRHAHLLNKKVGVYPLIPCKECKHCERGNYELCDHYNYLGSRCNGGFAEYVAVPAWNIIQVPEEISFEEAAMLEPAAVAMHALRQAELKTGDIVALWGPGTIGMILAQLAVIGGAEKVYIIGRDQRKLDFIKTLGFQQVCNSASIDPVKWLLEETGNNGVDINVEGTGAGKILNHCLETTAPYRTIVTLGNPGEDIHLEKQTYWRLLRKQLVIKGTWNSSFGTHNSDWEAILDLLEAGKLNLKSLISHRLPLSELNNGINLMKAKTTYTNKVMIVNGNQNE